MDTPRPDPSSDPPAVDPPQPVETLPAGVDTALGTVALTVAGAGALVLIAGFMTPTVGATRSTKLEWQRRKLLMDQAECDAAPGAKNEQPADPGRQDD
mgnify:CR=1 FL=1